VTSWASACAPYDTVVASFSSFIWSPVTSTAQTELRVSPNVPFSDVIDAMTSCRSTSASRMYFWKYADSLPWRAMHATWMWCIASTMPDEPQWPDSAAH
jgi:hypothetical protein